MLKNSGLRRACLYTLPPHQRGYCGPQDKEKSSLISDFVNGDRAVEKEVRDILTNEFIVSGYYKMIADARNIDDLFDWKVVEAYWLGNELLDKFFKAGKVVPYHLYHVIAVGSVTGRIRFDDSKREQCRISWGKVTKKKPVMVKCQPLLGRSIIKKVNWNKDFVPGLKIGDMVSLHWNEIIEVLTDVQVNNLKKYTGLILCSI